MLQAFFLRFFGVLFDDFGCWSMCYFSGGTDDSWTAFATAEQYNPLTDTWRRLPDMICPRIHPSATYHSHSGKVYVFGGRNSKKVELKSAEVYDPLTDKWTLMEEGMKVSAWENKNDETCLSWQNCNEGSCINKLDKFSETIIKLLKSLQALKGSCKL